MTNTKKHLRATGPRTPEGKKIASRNSIKHGFFSKVLTFKDAGEEAEYQDLLQGLFDTLQPTDRLQEILVEEIAVCCWKLRVSLAWAEREVRNRASRSINRTIQHFVEKSDVLDVPLPGIEDAPRDAGSVDDGLGSPGWECKEMVLRVTNGEQEQSGHAAMAGTDRSADTSTEAYAVEVRVADPMDTIMRYDTKIHRDLYRAIEQLNRLQELGAR